MLISLFTDGYLVSFPFCVWKDVFYLKRGQLGWILSRCRDKELVHWLVSKTCESISLWLFWRFVNVFPPGTISSKMETTKYTWLLFLLWPVFSSSLFFFLKSILFAFVNKSLSKLVCAIKEIFNHIIYINIVFSCYWFGFGIYLVNFKVRPLWNCYLLTLLFL